GITGKFISDKLGKVSASAFAVDFGTSFHASAGGRPIRASFLIQNLGSTVQHNGAALDVNVTRPPVPGQVDVPQEPQAAILQTQDRGLPVQFRVGVSPAVLALELSRGGVLLELNPPHPRMDGV